MKTLDDGGVCSPKGYRAAGLACGIKQSGKLDLALLVSDAPATVAGAFTRNFGAAPSVVIDRERLAAGGRFRALVASSGCANAWTGRQGRQDALETARLAAGLLDCEPEEVLISSTGRIGTLLPMDKLRAGLEQAVATLAPEGEAAAARAIMTTDTHPKSLAVEFTVGRETVRVGGMAKGAGMIAPNMTPATPHATMLAYLTTDAALDPGVLETCLRECLDKSFNRVTVDGDTSTNDTFLAFANGQAGNLPIRPHTYEYECFQRAFDHVAAQLARAMVLDGEGATKFVTVEVTGARTPEEARRCAMTIANSLLVKTAWFGGDPNWGRILDAAGYADVALRPEQVSLYYDQTPVVRLGVDAGTPEADLEGILAQPEFTVSLDLAAGEAAFTAWTCDLSYDYVKINAEYRT